MTKLRKAVFLQRPKCASNGAFCVLLCFKPRSVVIIAQILCFILKFDPSDCFIHPSFSRSVQMNLSTRPVARWSSTGEYITLILFRSQKSSKTLLVKQVP